MCTFIFNYENNAERKVEHIIRAHYSQGGIGYDIEEDELLTHNFPVGCTLHLFTKDSNFSINGNNLLLLEIQKES